MPDGSTRDHDQLEADRIVREQEAAREAARKKAEEGRE